MIKTLSILRSAEFGDSEVELSAGLTPEKALQAGSAANLLIGRVDGGNNNEAHLREEI